MRRPAERSSNLLRTEIQPGVWLDSRRALWFAADRLLVMADLHWGYSASHQARGNLLPSWGDEQIESTLRSLLNDYRPAEMLWLGDIVHAAEGAVRAERFLATAEIPITLLAGNHDRRWSGAVVTTARRAGFFFHHGDATPAVPAGCVAVIGHHHPAFTWSDGAGSRVKLPALVCSPHRWILPALSPWASGTDWRRELTANTVLWAIAPSRIFTLPAVRRLSVAV